MPPKTATISTWDQLVAISGNKKLAQTIRNQAQMYLNQLNTAGGKHLMESEAITWLKSLKHA